MSSFTGSVQRSSLFPKPKGISTGDQDDQQSAAQLRHLGCCLPKGKGDQITEWAMLQGEDAAAVNKYVACDAGPQAAALPDDDGIQKTDRDRVADLQHHADDIRRVGKVYNVPCAKGYGRNDDGSPQIIF